MGWNGAAPRSELTVADFGHLSVRGDPRSKIGRPGAARFGTEVRDLLSPSPGKIHAGITTGSIVKRAAPWRAWHIPKSNTKRPWGMHFPHAFNEGLLPGARV